MTSAPAGPVPIPVRLAGRPTTADLVHPWVNVQLADGGVDYRTGHHARWVAAWQQHRCQTCGQRLDPGRIVLLAGPGQLNRLLFDEPPTHPECAAYASDACPMLAGRMPTYADRPQVSAGKRGKTCSVPGCDCGGWVQHPGTGGAEGGSPAHAWYAIWVRGYRLAQRPVGELFGGAVTIDDVLRVRLVSTPGEGRVTRTLDEAEWRALVTDPAIREGQR